MEEGERTLTRAAASSIARSEEHTSELQSRLHLVCRLLLEKKKATHVTPLARIVQQITQSLDQARVSLPLLFRALPLARPIQARTCTAAVLWTLGTASASS